MEYQRKKVEKIKAQKPSKKDDLNQERIKRPVRPRPDSRVNRDTGFDIEDIPMSPQPSSDILNERNRKEPAHRDIRIGRREDKTTSSQGSAQGVDLKVIIGGKIERLKERKKTLIFMAVALVAALTVFIAAIATPANLFELMQNNFTLWGKGSGMPVEVGGSATLDIKTRGNTIFVLTDTRGYVYNRSGKQVQSIQHGYSNPELYVSDSRSLIYDRGGVKLRIDTLNTNIANKSLSENIITATLSDSGRVGVITEGEKSVSQLVVSDDTFTEFSAWASTERLTAVALSRFGDKAAVSAVTSSSGNFRSIVYLLDISDEKITEIDRIEFDSTPIVTLQTVGNRVFAVGTDFISSFDFDGDEKVEKTVNYLKHVKFDDGRVLVSNSPSNNVQKTQITIFNNELEEKQSITVNGNCDNISICGDGISALFGNSLVMYDKYGKELKSENVGYEGIKVASYRDGTAVLADMKLAYYEYGDGN